MVKHFLLNILTVQVVVKILTVEMVNVMAMKIMLPVLKIVMMAVAGMAMPALCLIIPYM